MPTKDRATRIAEQYESEMTTRSLKEDRAALDKLHATLWQGVRDGTRLDELVRDLGLTCPDCGGEPGGYYVGERFIQNECDLCGRVGSE